ncbi:MAG: dienelactone hydrolase family protein [Burkholderiales bacterium]|nr:dienelactone hydrolase family protein [Burkholderiales bacterium]
MQEQQDISSLTGASGLDGKLDRRTFLQAALGAGFAAAALPVCGQTVIHTDSEGLLADRVMLDIAGQQVPVYRAQPQGKRDLPVVLVVSEIFGVHAHIADVARRFAKQGYLALAPELFVRQGDAAGQPSIAALLKEVIAKVPDAQVIGDLDAVADWAGKNGGDLNKLAITGFCWGGRIAWLYAAHNPAVKAGVAWYGRLNGDAGVLTPRHPIDIAATLKTPVLGLYGAKDGGIGAEAIFKMQTELAKGGSRSEFKIYPNSGHAFHADYRPSYVEADAKDGWARCLAWFREHGVA